MDPALWLKLCLDVLGRLKFRRKPAPVPPRPILIVEDDSNDAILVMRVLKAAGHVCDWTESGDHALMLISKASYRMCIIDIGLRVGMNGYALAKEIRKEHPYMPIWLTTGSQDNLFCVEPGIAIGLVLKSVRVEAFLDAVRMTAA